MMMMLVTILTQRVSAQQESDLQTLEKVVRAELAETGTPGAIVVVVSRDRAVLVKGFGIANIETGSPVTAETMFRIGGMSKFLVATVALSMAAQGKLELDAPIGSYINGLSPKLSRVTARQLLTETAGVKEDHLRLGLYDDAALGNTVRDWQDDWLIAEPGTIRSSSHPGYAVAGLLLEEIGGKPFDDVMRERLFSPLGMDRSTFRPMVAFTYPMAVGHHVSAAGNAVVVRPFAGNSVGWPSYSLFSTAKDLSAFLLTMMNDGQLHGHSVISQSVVSTLTMRDRTGQTPDSNTYGLALAKFGSLPILEGTYTWAGMRPLIRIVPDARLALVVISNGGTRHLTGTVNKAMRMFLPHETAVRSETEVERPMAQGEISKYTGTFANERVITLYARNGVLFMRDDTPPGMLGTLTEGVDLPVSKIGDNQFAVSPPGRSGLTRFSFIAGPEGTIAYMHIGGRALKKRTCLTSC
jgi:CubicO group peptidase (beta-lactamase class C family)